MFEMFPRHRPHHDVLRVFAEEKSSEHGFLRASAPMVRYSKLEFRKLIRQHGVKLCFTPMIIADSFNSSQKARDNEFTTSSDDFPLIAQFAASNANEFATAAQLIYPYVDGVDVNCGCPQSWAIAKGYGCGLLRQPQVLYDIVKTIRRTLPADFSISLKLRLLNGDTVRSTVDLVRQLEKCGATFITLHGRTTSQRTSDPVNIDAMTEVKKSLRVPLIVNGNVRTWEDACQLHRQTNADGVMAARGLLSNPALFNPQYNDHTKTPLECVQQWLDISTQAGDNIQFQCFHHHLTFMWSSHIKRKLRMEFNNFTQKREVCNFFADRYGLKASLYALKSPFSYVQCTYTHTHNDPLKQDSPEHETYNSGSNGKYFNEFKNDSTRENPEECNYFNLEGSFFTNLA